MPRIATNSRAHGPPPRQRILDASVRLFAARGFEGATTRAIAREAEVNEAVIFRHFPTKRRLYAAIIENKIREEPARRLVHAASATDEDDRAVFTRIALRLFDIVQKDPDFLRILYFSGLEGHDLSSIFFKSFARQLHLLIRDRLARGAAQKRFRKLDPYLAARAFMGMIGHYLLARELFGRAFKPCAKQKVIDTFVDIFLHGILTK